jgi:hypothetical protein
MIKPVPLWLNASFAALCLVIAGTASGQETLSPPSAAMTTSSGEEFADDEPPPLPPYRLRARVLVGEREMWAGYLAMTNYGRANVRTYVQDMDANCPLKNDRFAQRRHTIDLLIEPGRREGPFLYSVEANWTSPAADCSDEGTRATGVRVEVELAANQTRVIEGERGLRVEVTRLP